MVLLLSADVHYVLHILALGGEIGNVAHFQMVVTARDDCFVLAAYGRYVERVSAGRQLFQLHADELCIFP